MANEELTKRVYVRELKSALNLNQIVGDDSSLNRWIIVPDINRPGLELTGYLEGSELKRVVIIGNKEMKYLGELDYEVQKERLQNITDTYTPCIIVSSMHRDCPQSLIEVASSKNFPVFRYEGPSYQAAVDIINYLSEKMAPSDSVYGVMMNIFGIGVLITGDSGIGKSELALDLIKKGHMLVSDDRVDVISVHNELKASAPSVLKGLLEVRGLGVVDVSRLFGVESVLDSSNIKLVINLVKFDKDRVFNRIGNDEKEMEILGIKLPLIEIPVSEGRPISIIIQTVVSNYLLKRQGIDTTSEFMDRVTKEIEKNKENQ